jgi:hypothetical protein
LKKILLFILISFSFETVYSQSGDDVRFITRGETIEEALNKWVVQFNTNLVYDPALELADESYVDVTSNLPGVVLTEIISNTGLDYIILSTGTYVLIQRTSIVEEYGEFFGYVYDEETGEPLADATIFFADASNSTSTNSQGFFSVSPLLSGTYPVIISSVGYQPIVKDLEIADSTEMRIIRLTPKMFTTDPIIVQADAISLGISKWANQIQVDQNSGLNSAVNPSIAPIQNIPGLTLNTSTNSLSIYGSNPSTMSIYLDGVRLFNTARIGDELGMFSSMAIDRIGTSRAAGSISKEGSLNGMLNFQHDVTDRIEDSRNKLNITPNDVNARSEFQLNKTSIAVSARTNHGAQDVPWGYDEVYQQWNQFDPLLQNFLMGDDNDIAHYKAQIQEADYRYSDLHFVAKHSPNRFSSTKFSGYFGSRDEDASLLSQKSSLGSAQPYLVYNEEESETTNGMFNVEHFRIFNASTDLFMKASYSASAQTYAYAMIQNDETISHSRSNEAYYSVLRSDLRSSPSSIDEQTVNELAVSAQLTKYLSAENTLIVGIKSSQIDHSFTLNDIFYLPLSNDAKNYRSDIFLEQKLRTSNNFNFEYGLKGSISSLQNVVYLQPQLSVSYDSDKTNLGFQTVQFSAGMYRQFIQQFDIANIGPSAIRSFNRIDIPVDNSISAPVSYQLKLDWNIQYSEKSSLKIETYYRNEPKSYSLNYTQLLAGSTSSLQSQTEFLEETSTIAYGAAITFTQELSDPALLFTISQQSNISTIRFEERFNSERIQSGWSEPYATFGSIRWQFNKPVSLQLQSRWVPKRYWSFTRAYYDFLTTHNKSDFGDYSFSSPDDDQLNAFFSLDIGVNARVPIASTSLLVNLNLQNITNRKNEVSNILIPQRNEQQAVIYTKTSRNLAGVIPFLSLQLDF